MSGMTPREAADFVAKYERQAADRKGGFGGLSGPWGRAVQTLVDHARATTPSDDRGRELADEINARADEADPPVATVGVSTLRRWATTVRALAAAPEGEAGGDLPWTSRELGDRNAADRMETWLREDKPSHVLDQWTEDLERLIVAARHGRRQPAPATPQAEGGGETGDDPPDLIDGLGHRWWPGGIRQGRRCYMPWYQSAWDAAGAFHRHQLIQPVREVRRDERPTTLSAEDKVGNWAALRSKLNEWLAEDGISPYRRTAFVQVLEWLDAHGTASGDDER